MPETIPLRFGGVARLYGQSALDRFLRSKVAVIGIGGVGSWTVEALARSGIGHLTLVDLDEICLTNVNRQLHAMDGQIGRQKTESMAERARAIHPTGQITVVPSFFNESSVAEILDSGYDLVIDAIDSVRHKALLIAECVRRGIPVITCGSAGGRRDPTRIRVADLAHSGKDPMLLQLRRSLRNYHHFLKTPPGTEPPPFGIEAVYSDESPVYPQADGSVSCEGPVGPDRGRAPNDRGRINCRTGFGTATHVTASFGMIIAARALEHLAKTGLMKQEF